MLDDDTAHDLAICVPLEWSDAEVELLSPLVDATLVWAEDETLDRIAASIAATIWETSLRSDLETALIESAAESRHVRKSLRKARKDLAAGPQRSRVARWFLTQAAIELAFREQEPVHCLLCVEESLWARAPSERRARALRVARMARRAAAVPEAELRAAVATATFVSEQGDAAVALATDARRRAVRAWLARLAELGVTSVPTLSGQLSAVAAEPFPPAPQDDVWRETVAGLVEGLVEPWN